jgi:hypothetical protein
VLLSSSSDLGYSDRQLPVYPLTKTAPRDIWGAPQVWFVYILTFFPNWLLDWVALRIFKLNKPAPKAIKEE